MNSDPYDSAAWRTFGMLDADESSIFDDAMSDDPALRKYSLEMDRLSAAIAASTAPPVDPGAAQLEQIENRLNLNPARRLGIWLAASGWAAALALALALFVGRGGSSDEATTTPPAAPLESSANPTKAATKTPTKAVAKRLNQEIVVLRENLEKFQHRDRLLFAAVPGRALPIVMTMTPPGVPAEDSPITTLLGDAMRATTTVSEEDFDQDSDEFSETEVALPSAMPIYDSARDLGTLVVNNLPDAGEGERYNLWVTTESDGQPVYVGSLPESGANGADSFDFSLGSTMVLPSGFTLTKDPADAPASPSADNIVLQGPPVSSK